MRMAARRSATSSSVSWKRSHRRNRKTDLEDSTLALLNGVTQPMQIQVFSTPT
jgi:hypothetical protein